MKNNYGGYLNLYKYFLHPELLASNTIRSQRERKLKILLRTNLVKYPSNPWRI